MIKKFNEFYLNSRKKNKEIAFLNSNTLIKALEKPKDNEDSPPKVIESQEKPKQIELLTPFSFVVGWTGTQSPATF
jgi:hypothetical protein